MRELTKDLMQPKDTCSICGCDYDEDEGGIQGYFGIMPVTFCVWCYASIQDMVIQDLDLQSNNFDDECGMSRK